MQSCGFEFDKDEDTITILHHFTGREKVIRKEFSMNQWNDSWTAWENGMLIQEAFYYLDVDTREFMISGLNSEEFDEACNIDGDE